METKKITQQELNSSIGKGPMYFYYGFEDAVVRSEYTGKDVVFYVKFQGEPEFRAEKGSGIVTEALMVPVTISKDDYDNF